MKTPLKRFTIAVTGDFGEQRSHGNMKNWIEVQGGKFSRNVTPQVTHLICSKEHWKAKTAAVREALRYRPVNIVSFDWLEDSLMEHRPLKEGKYLMSRLERIQEKAKEIQKETKEDHVGQGSM